MKAKKEMNGRLLVKQQIAFQCKCEKHDDIYGKGSWVEGRDCRGSEDVFGKKKPYASSENGVGSPCEVRSAIQ